MNNAKISIVVVIYKVEAYLEKCLDSLKNQTYKNIEVILSVSDGGDSCVDICKKYAEEDDRFIVVQTQPNGIASARNSGMEKVSGEYLTWVDGDDWVLPNYVQDLYDTIMKFGTDMSICGYAKAYDDNSIPVISTLPTDRPIPLKDVYKEILLYKSFGMEIWDKLFISSKVKDIPFPKVTEAEDRYWLSLVLDSVETLSYIDKPDYQYRIRGDSSSHNVDNAGVSFDSDKAMAESITNRYKELEPEASLFLFFAKYRVFYEMLHVNIVKDKAVLKDCYLEIRKYAPGAKRACIRFQDKIKINISMCGYGIFKLFVTLLGKARS